MMTYFGLSIYQWLIVAGLPTIYLVHWAIRRKVKDEIIAELRPFMQVEIESILTGKFDRKIGEILDGYSSHTTSLAKSVEALATVVVGLTKSVEALEKRMDEHGKDIRELRKVVMEK